MIVSRLLGAVHLAAAVAVATGSSGPVRFAVVGAWLLVVPGWSFVAHVRADVATRTALAVSVSFALALVVSTLLVQADRYRFQTAFWSLFVLATPGIVLAQTRPLRRLEADAGQDVDAAEDLDADASG